MSVASRLSRWSLSLPIALLATGAAGFAQSSGPSLTYLAGSTVKLEQIIGDCDWADLAATGVCKPTTSQTITRFDVEGNGLGYSFEFQSRLLFLFGDTIGVRTNYHAHDPIAWSTTTDREAGLLINFYTNSDGSTLLVEPPGVQMAGFDVPNSGIGVGNQVYIVCNTGSDTSLSNVHAHDFSVLARFDPATQKFFTGRTISRIPGGHFIITALHDVPVGAGVTEPSIAMFGLGDYRASDVYLSLVPTSQIESGTGTRYFAGLSNGQPTWTTTESAAVPVMSDNPLHGPAWPHDSPTIGNVSVSYSSDLALWLMTYDGGRQSEATTGVYFAYAPQPWGPWTQPQLIFNGKRDHGFGVFIHDQNLNPPGPAGPTIGTNDPNTTRGGDFAPQMIERFTRVDGDTLSLYYTMSTWNPYTVVKMRSDFKLVRDPKAPCVPGTATLCIDDAPGDQRFEVTAQFATSEGGGRSGAGQAIPLTQLGVGHGGLFWFFDATNPELLVKVLDACTVNQQFWLYFAAGTNVGFTLTARDTHTGAIKTYSNADLSAAAPVQDTSAFACGGSASSTAAMPARSALAAPTTPTTAGLVSNSCTPSASTLCINNRFRVKIHYQTSQGGGLSGNATAIPLASLGVNDGGLFWFFGADNPEVLIKVLDACSVNNNFWIFYSATTNAGFTVTVDDLVTGLSKTYSNTDLQAAPPVQDTAALSCVRPLGT